MKDHETCGNKRRYWSWSDATIAADIVANKYKRPTKVYRCPTCQGWHLATIRKARRSDSPPERL